MTDRLYESIKTGLETIKFCPVYKEELPPEFARPSFLIALKEQTLQKGINGRQRHAAMIDITYYPEDEQNPNPESQRLGLDLASGLQLADFRMKKRSWRIEENILHLLFEVEIWSYQADEAPSMQSLSQNTNFKQEE